MNTDVLLIKAKKEPMKNVEKPLPNQIHKFPHLEIQKKKMGSLDSNSIRLEMLYVGICGSDSHLMKINENSGYISSSAPLDIPEEGRIIGHEGVGKIIEVGDNVHHLTKGMIVTLESIMACEYCDVCRRGDFNQCRNAKLIGLEADGIMGTIVDVKAALAHDITGLVKNEQDLMAMACVEPAGVSYVACENAEVKPGDRVVIFGAGPIGAYCAMFCKTILGASQVHVVEPIEHRRKLVEEWTTSLSDSVESLLEKVSIADVVIETSGDLSNVNQFFKSIDANGRVVALARSGQPLTLDSVDHMITNNIRITGSRGHLAGAFEKIIRLYQAGNLPLIKAVTSVVDGLEDLKSVLEENKIQEKDCKMLVKLANMEAR